MKMFFFKNRFDNVVTDESSFDLTWEELIEFFALFQERNDKDGMLFVASTFTLEPPFKQAVKTSSDDSSKELIFNSNGNPAVGRYSENVSAITAIILDCDKDWTIEDAKATLVGVRHLGYTSFSHRRNGNGDRFRVIIPLKDPCPKVEWERRRASIRALFPHVDGSTVALARAFYTPAVPPDTRHLAHAWSEDGEILDWRDFARTPDPPPPPILDTARIVSAQEFPTGRVVWETCDMVQFFKDKGWYIRGVDSVKHEVVCPNVLSHTNQIAAGTVVYQDGIRRPRLYCSHAHCEHQNKEFFNQYREELVEYCSREKPKQVQLRRK